MAGKNKGCGVTIKVRLQIVASVLVYIARRLNTSMSRSGLLHFSGVRQKWPSAHQNRGGGKRGGAHCYLSPFLIYGRGAGLADVV